MVKDADRVRCQLHRWRAGRSRLAYLLPAPGPREPEGGPRVDRLCPSGLPGGGSGPRLGAWLLVALGGSWKNDDALARQAGSAGSVSRDQLQDADRRARRRARDDLRPLVGPGPPIFQETARPAGVALSDQTDRLAGAPGDHDLRALRSRHRVTVRSSSSSDRGDSLRGLG